VTDPADDDAAGPPGLGDGDGPPRQHGGGLAQVEVGQLRFDRDGLVPVVVQQHDTGEVLMVAWADAPAIERTVALGEAVFYSRSRREQWHKGATSGNTQRVLDVRVDCDADVLLYLVDQGADGVACHTGERSCFHRRLGPTARPRSRTGQEPTS
jgi:phosphoribosyl-AMP cyclohydrolase